ncbi:hypothetical protein TWF481_008093 [Arthrobotrys musiformis]|uniref:O-methyltransferase C-terminal domain-containing protein n=1 Tax=Arthrobotrys musiformis TaxID=47236 RepID=A0AAV9W651_9PEZI
MAPTNGYWPTGGAPILRPKISELVQEIAENSKILEDYIISQGLPYPSFAADGPSACPLPPPKTPELIKLHAARTHVLTASKLLHDLTAGPAELIQWSVLGFNDTSSLQVIYRFKIAQAVPETGDISFNDLSKKVKIPAIKLGQILRFAMTNHIFCEPRNGYVAHTAASLLLRDENAPPSAWVGCSVDEFFGTAKHLSDSLEKDPGGIHDSSWAMEFEGQGYFEYLSKDAKRSNRFGLSMSQWSSGYGLNAENLLRAYDWTKIRKGATIVDVGGATGFVCIEIAKSHPHLNFQIQDLSVPSLETGKKNIAKDSPELASRFQFVEHNFFNEQPTKGADVYFLRFILHDWPDNDVMKILKNLVPALKNGSKIIICDYILPPANVVNPWEERRIRSTDILMLGLFHSYERQEADWKRLFAEVDPRLRFDGFSSPEGSLTGVIETTYVE